MSNETGEEGVARSRGALLAALPRVLLALAGACALSAGIGLVAAMLGRAEPPLLLMLLPPAAVLVAVPILLLRSRKPVE